MKTPSKSLVFGILFILALLTLGCCGTTLPSTQQQGQSNQPSQPTLPTSFCSSLSTSTIRDTCISAANNRAEDDQRLRDFLTYWDTYLESLYGLNESTTDLSEAGDAWNRATTYEERHSAYRAYNVAAQNYAAKIELLSTHSTNFENFLRENKDYLDSQGFNTLSQINLLITQRSDLSSTLYQISDNLQMMGSTLQLEQQEQEQNQALIQTIMQLALGLI